MNDEIRQDVDAALCEKLLPFKERRLTGIIRVEVTVSEGEPTGMNVETKENRKVKKQRERFPVR